ncbi:MAG: hypothetical protein CVT62_08530 [Actinobacteria bacterium HGW-Actinobacteria-2]|nr:MAG: hypothetical protein CVT62_08530 [Actinobacteria bacterium HGW-Actinobacteria-2]
MFFLIHHLEAWYSLADVYAEMAAADDFLPLVASIPRRFPGAREFQDEELVHDGLTKFGIPHIRLRSDDSFQDLAVVRAFSPDVVFRQSQWDLDVPDAFTTNELAFARLCLVPYEPMGLVRNPADSAINPGYDCAYYRQAWRVFLANDLARDEVMSQAPATRPDQYVVTGHPKADLLRRKITLGAPGADRPFTILWSAHHSIDDHWVRFGMFHRMALDMVEMAQRHPEWRFVLSLHPALAVKLESADPPLDADFVAAFWRDWNGLPNTSLFPGGDYGPLFANTDALLCDGLSWLLEYQLAGKPVVFLQREGHRPFNALGNIALTGMNQVDSLPIAEGLFEQFAAGRPDPHKPAQAEVVAALFGSSGAASRIVAAIRTGLVAD